MAPEPTHVPADVSARCIGMLPQARPFLFVDQIVSVAPGAEVTAEVTFAADHPVFDGHLPGYPLVPGVIVIEALAQASGLVLMPEELLRGEDPGAMSEKGFGYLAEVRRVRFKRAVLPGETMTMHCRLGRAFGTAASFEVTASVGGEVAADGEIVVGGMR